MLALICLTSMQIHVNISDVIMAIIFLLCAGADNITVIPVRE